MTVALAPRSRSFTASASAEGTSPCTRYTGGRPAKLSYQRNRLRLVAMRGQSAQRVNLRATAHALAVDAHFRLAVDELAAQRARRLEADDDHVALGPLADCV